MDWISISFWLVGTLILVLGPMILVHELGHFITAKLFGVRVEEFGLGFPPRLLKLWYGKGELRIGSTRVMLPPGLRRPEGLELGAWVDALTERRDDGTYIVRRLEVLDPDKGALTTRRYQVDEGVHMRGELTALEPGTLYSLNGLPMGAFVRMTGEEDPSDPGSLAAQPKGQRIAVLAAGALLNILVAVMLIVGAYSAGVPDKWLVEVTDVMTGSAAEAAGIQPQDVIVAVDGVRLEEGMEQLRQSVRAAPQEPLEMTILREDETLTLTATPKRGDDGAGLLGILMAPWPDQSELRHYGVPEALTAGVTDLSAAVAATFQAPARLAQGEITPQEARPSSVVGISQVLAFTLQQSIRWGLVFPVMQTAALISLALGLTNLLPLPALDGGRIVFVLIEAIRGRRIPPEREAMFHFVGLVVFVTLMAWVMMQDFINPVIPWSYLR